MALTDKDFRKMAEKVRQHVEQTMKVYLKRNDEPVVFNKNDIEGFLIFHEIELDDIEDSVTVDYKKGIFWCTYKQPAEILTYTTKLKMPEKGEE